jgi:hypothetical protein
MRQSSLAAPTLWRIALALLVTAGLVAPSAAVRSQAPNAGTAQTQKAPLPKVRYGTEGLPRPVLDLREALLAAIESGRIEELAHALELSHLAPDLGAPPKTDPVAHWKSVSGDGQGLEVLAALSLIIDAGYVAIPRGADIENNQLYVWPYFAALPLAKLTPRQEVELLRLVPVAAARAMKEKGQYTHWRLVIGADGAWHALRKGE